MLAHRTRGVPTRNGSTTVRQLPSAPCFERTETSGDESVARQGALIGDSLNDEQWSDNLSNPSLHSKLSEDHGLGKAQTWVSARMGEKVSMILFWALHGPRTNSEVTA